MVAERGGGHRDGALCGPVQVIRVNAWQLAQALPKVGTGWFTAKHQNGKRRQALGVASEHYRLDLGRRGIEYLNGMVAEELSEPVWITPGGIVHHVQGAAESEMCEIGEEGVGKRDIV